MGACCSAPAVAGGAEPAQDNDPTGGLATAYDVKYLLGSGSAGDTWLCHERGGGGAVAIKLMRRPIPPLMGSSIMREVKIGAELGKGHLNVVKAQEVVLTRTHLGLVMEYVSGGNMADYILKSILLKFGDFDRRDGLVLDEDEALYFFKQVISAVEYCHQHKVAHRDLKMDNTLLDDHSPPRIKLCDFGFARNWMGEPQMTTITGTPDYMSPQLLGAKLGAPTAKPLYDGTKVDIWAAGVMLCVMLIGRFPFEGTEMNNVTSMEEVSLHVWQQQTNPDVRWHDNPLIKHDCEMMSPDCIDLLNRIFELDEGKRITISGIKAHPWFNRTLPALYQGPLDTLAAEQAEIDKQAAAGMFVCRNRDSALKSMIFLASAPYNPDQEGAATLGGGGGGGGAAALLRKISLVSVLPAGHHQHSETGGQQPDSEALSKWWREHDPAAAAVAADADAAAGGGGLARVDLGGAAQAAGDDGGAAPGAADEARLLAARAAAAGAAWDGAPEGAVLSPGRGPALDAAAAAPAAG